MGRTRTWSSGGGRVVNVFTAEVEEAEVGVQASRDPVAITDQGLVDVEAFRRVPLFV